MLTSLFDYDLPPDRIAQQPAEPRDSSRLLVLDRATGGVTHAHFRDVGRWLRPGDLLVANDSRVIPARLAARKSTGGAAEILLLRALEPEGRTWLCLVRASGLRPGSRLILEESLTAVVEEVRADGPRVLRFSEPVRPYLDTLGAIPLPPYITDYHADPERYQTVYSLPEGSAAAPTAGLHFTPELILSLREQGVAFETVTLHVGLDTFRPVDSETVEGHTIHTEWAEMTPETARRINDVTLRGGRVVAVGTTAVRTLEWAATAAQGVEPYAQPEACPWQRVAAFTGDVRLFIRPGYRYRAVDALITNFHLPKSSLLMLVSAFVAQAHPNDEDAGRRMLLETYEVAKSEGYRFFSFGDAMIIV